MAGRLTLYKVIVTLLCTLSCNDIAPCIAFEDCNAIYMNGEQIESPGKCTTFPECPVLFDILKSPYKTNHELRLLQKLTCRPDNENPTVCCAVEDIVSETNNTDYAISKHPAKQNIVSPNDGIVFESDSYKPSVTKYKTSTDKPIQVAFSSSSNGKGPVHPNFDLLPSLLECSSRVGADDRILGGTEVSILEYPWLGRIGYYSHDEQTIKYLCAATVISKRYVLTAAHCTQEINPEEFEPVHIRLAERDRNCSEIYGCSDPIDIKIEHIIPHPNYNKRDKSNDIGLIRVAEDIPFDSIFVKPVCLPFVEEYGISDDIVDPILTKYADTGKESAIVAGWGKTRWTNQEGSPFLMHVRLPVVSHTQCQKNYQNHTRVIITRKQICAGGISLKDSCGGDSGGGLFVVENVPVLAKIKKLRVFQFAIVSFGPTHCAVGGLPGVYSNVYEYKNWILDQLKP